MRRSFSRVKRRVEFLIKTEINALKFYRTFSVTYENHRIRILVHTNLIWINSDLRWRSFVMGKTRNKNWFEMYGIQKPNHIMMWMKMRKRTTKKRILTYTNFQIAYWQGKQRRKKWNEWRKNGERKMKCLNFSTKNHIHLTCREAWNCELVRHS